MSVWVKLEDSGIEEVWLRLDAVYIHDNICLTMPLEYIIDPGVTTDERRYSQYVHAAYLGASGRW